MTDLYDLEAEMLADQGHGPEWEAKVSRARARVVAFNALPREQQLGPCDQSCLIPEVRRVAMRPF